MADYRTSHHEMLLDADDCGVSHDNDVKVPPPLTRPARFWQGASIPFQILESIHILENDVPKSHFWETVGILHDIQLVLEKCHKYTNDLDSHHVAQLRLLFDKIYSNVRESFLSHLKAISHIQPAEPPTSHGVNAWFVSISECLEIARGIAKDLGHEKPLNAVRLALGERYHVYHERFVADRTTTNAVSVLPPFKFGEAIPTLNWTEECFTSDQSPTSIEVSRALNHLVVFYRSWCRRDKSDCSAIPVLLSQLDHIRNFVGRFLCKDVNGHSSTKELGPDATIRVLYTGWCKRFVSRYTRAVRSDLQLRYTKLMEDTQLPNHMEESERQSDFLVQNLRAAAFLNFGQILETEWSRWAPQLICSATYNHYISELQTLHDKIQAAGEAHSEQQRLWYSLWRGLKTNYTVLESLGFAPQESGSELEQLYFDDIVIQSMFKTVLGSPEVLNPDIIENLIAMYCIAIAQAQLQQNCAVATVRGNLPVNDYAFTVITRFQSSHEWNLQPMFAMRKLAARLNFLFDGPAYVRRVPKGTGYWKLDKLHLHPHDNSSAPQVPVYRKPCPSTTSFSLEHRKDPSQICFSNIFESQSLNDSASRQLPATLPSKISAVSKYKISKRSVPSKTVKLPDAVITPTPGLVSQNVISSFDFVHYSQPESRAVEVAQSQQIRRELRSTGIQSRGALVQDVFNLPPRHTWKPGQVSIWAKRLPYGPFDVVKALWSKMIHSRQSRAVHPARTRPTVANNKSVVDHHRKQSTALSPVRDAKSRIGKTPLDKIKLRGGGGGGGGGQVDYFALRALFMARVSGFWPNGEVPTNLSMRRDFLEPANWQLDQAVQLARQHARNLRLTHARQERARNIVPGTNGSLVAQAQGDRSGAPSPVNAGAVDGDASLQASPVGQASTAARPLPNGHHPGYALPATTNPASTSPPDIPIYIDPSSPPNPVGPRSASPSPVGNQQHQAQIDNDRNRRNQGLPPVGQQDNHSDQENNTPQGRRPLGSLSPGSTPVVFACAATSCHPCPVYANQVHHMCPSWATNQTVSNGPGGIPPARSSSQPSHIPDSSSPIDDSASLTSPNQRANAVNSGGGGSSNTDGPNGSHQQTQGNTPNPAGSPTSVAPSQAPAPTQTQTQVQIQTQTPSGSARGRGGRRSRGPRSIAPTTRTTRRQLARINNTRSPGSQLTIDQANSQGGSQALLSNNGAVAGPTSAPAAGQPSSGPSVQAAATILVPSSQVQSVNNTGAGSPWAASVSGSSRASSGSSQGSRGSRAGSRRTTSRRGRGRWNATATGSPRGAG